MTGRPERGSPADWLRYARSDLLVSEARPQPGVLLETLTFHAQQAAEKAIKAILLHVTGEEPPFTHDLTRLLNALSPYIKMAPLDHVAAESLTRYAVISRYPPDLGEVDEPEWKQAVADARAVMEWAAQVIP